MDSDTSADIETGLLPEVPELGQKPEKSWTPVFGFLYLLIFFGLVAIFIVLFLKYMSI